MQISMKPQEKARKFPYFPLQYFRSKLLFGKKLLNYLNINSRHRKDLQRWILLRRKPEKLPLAFVPFHRVECVALKVVLADQIYIFASLHSCRHEYSHVLQRHDKVWKMEKVFHFLLERMSIQKLG